MKACNLCGVKKELFDFHFKKSGKDGHENSCKTCRNSKIKVCRKLKIERYKKNTITVKKKKCFTCSKTKSSSEYNKRCEYEDGLDASCKLCMKEYKEKWRNEHAEDKKESDARYREANKEKVKESQKKYREANMGKYAAYATKRRAAKLKRIPKWITKEELKAIEGFYENCPNGMHVDHIIPLQGELVSGFHVLSNLQYLTPEENSKKSNKFEPYTI